MPCRRNPCRLSIHLAFTCSYRWSLKRSVKKRTWTTGSAFSTNESGWSVTVTGSQPRGLQSDLQLPYGRMPDVAVAIQMNFLVARQNNQNYIKKTKQNTKFQPTVRGRTNIISLVLCVWCPQKSCHVISKTSIPLPFLGTCFNILLRICILKFHVHSISLDI